MREENGWETREEIINASYAENGEKCMIIAWELYAELAMIMSQGIK